MKLQLTFLFSLFFILVSFSQESGTAIFLHRSTGNAVYTKGDVPGWISDYNSENSTNFQISERSFPGSGGNYSYDYWHLWADGACNPTDQGTQCLNTLAEEYDLVIFKHCYPGSSILEDGDNPSAAPSRKCLANYKAQYRDLRTEMDELPNTEFMVWTLAPLHRLSTNAENAARSNEFVQWVKNEWLQEDGKEHPNIHIFDFFNHVAELESNPTQGQQYCLKYEYEKDHNSGDSHPNTAANTHVGPFFARAVVDVLSGRTVQPLSSENPSIDQSIVVYPNPGNGDFKVISDSFMNPIKLQVYTLLGEKVMEIMIAPGELKDVQIEKKGVYLFKFDGDGKSIYRRVVSN